MAEADIIARAITCVQEVDAGQWNALLAAQSLPTPFMRHEYLAALQESGSATPETGWTPCFITLWQGDALVAACPLYVKSHSYGEYVFDWAWASAYEEHGMAYYPKAVVAVPFTPVPGSRLMARSAPLRAMLLQTATDWCQAQGISSLHVLFASPDDTAAMQEHAMMLRHTVQFHWNNHLPAGHAPQALPTAQPPQSALTPPRSSTFAHFDDFLASLNQEKRKKIRQERRKVQEAGVQFRWALGTDIRAADWDFFYRCYERTYLEHGNPPYLSRDFFHRMAADMPENWLLFVAERDGRPIASSLVAIQAETPDSGQPATTVAYGRYWGALERVDSLHFEACYYQPLQWCIAHGVQRFEGGAQGEHKMARALLPVQASSGHWLAHPGFAQAVERFLAREGQGIENYLEHLQARTPFKSPASR